MSDNTERQKLDDLEARIRQAQGSPAKQPADVSGDTQPKGSNPGYELAGTTIGCLIIGWLIDTYAHTSPWGILGMLGVGVVAGFMNVWRALNGYDRSVGLHKKDEGKGNINGR